VGRQLRTYVYHEILLGYAHRYAKALGINTDGCIWSCPPPLFAVSLLLRLWSFTNPSACFIRSKTCL
jgi:hypothetical protein